MASPRARKAQPAPQAAAVFFRSLVEQAPQMLWAADARGSIVYVNPRFDEYVGLQARQLGHADWLRFVHPQDRPYAAERWAASVRTGEPFECQYRFLRHDGSYRWHVSSARAQRDEAGRVVSWAGSCADVEEQMRAAQVHARRAGAGAEAEVGQRLRSIMTLWSDFYWETDEQHRFTVLEKGGRFDSVMFVATRIGRTRWDAPAVWPDAEGWRRHRATLDAHLPFRDFETARKGDDGVVHHYSVDGEPMFDAKGRFRGYRGVGREITARKLAEQALRQTDRRFREFLDSMPAVAWIKDSALRVVWISASYARLFGRTPDEMRGRDDFDLWPEAIARQYRRDDELALRANGPVQSVEDARYADGTPSRWHVVKFPFPDATGANGVAGIGFDVTAQHMTGDAAHAPAEPPLERLSGRERQVLQLIVGGLTSAEAGERLGLSPKSVDTYRSRLMAKLGIGDLPSLVKFALRHGLTTGR